MSNGRRPGTSLIRRIDWSSLIRRIAWIAAQIAKGLLPDWIPSDLAELLSKQAQSLWGVRGALLHRLLATAYVLIERGIPPMQALHIGARQLNLRSRPAASSRPGLSDVQVRQYHRRQQQRGRRPGQNPQMRSRLQREFEYELTMAAAEAEMETTEAITESVLGEWMVTPHPNVRRSPATLRRQARSTYFRLFPRYRRPGVEIHHRIPLEYRRRFPGVDPNRLSNLQPLTTEAHRRRASDMWDSFRNTYRRARRPPTPAEIVQYAGVVDRSLNLPSYL
jgi:hypothetical protein